MGLGGGDVGEHGRDNDPGYGGGGSSSGGGNRSGGNLSDVTKAMLSSPTASQYNNFYASKLPTMGQPGGTWGDFSRDLSGLMGNIGTSAYNGFLGLVDAPINMANRLPGVNIPTLSTPPSRPPGLDIMDPTPQETVKAYDAAGMAMPPDVVQSLMRQDMALRPDEWGFFDKTVMPATAKFTSKAIANTINPLAFTAMAASGVPMGVLANPVTQKATGFLSGGIGSSIADMAMRDFVTEKVMGTGIYGGNPSYGLGVQDSLGENNPQALMAYTPQTAPPRMPQNAYQNAYKGYMGYGLHS